MKPLLYRLYDIQKFKGYEIAVYINHGDFPDIEILNDAITIASKQMKYDDLVATKFYKYGGKRDPERTEEHTQTRLTLKETMIWVNRAIKKKTSLPYTKYAIFKTGNHAGDWRGLTDLYENESLDLYKTNIPDYSGCKLIKEIKL